MRYLSPRHFVLVPSAMAVLTICLLVDSGIAQQPASPLPSNEVRYNPHASVTALKGAKAQTPQRQTVTRTPIVGDVNLGRPIEAIPRIPSEITQLLPPGCLETWSGPPGQSLPNLNPQMTHVGSAGTSAGPEGDWLNHVPAIAVANQVGLDSLGDLDQLGPPGAESGGDALLEMGASGDPLSGFGAGDDPLGNLGPSDPGATRGVPALSGGLAPGGSLQSTEPEDPHRAVFLENRYPSALTCAKCHPKHFDEWRVRLFVDFANVPAV